MKVLEPQSAALVSRVRAMDPGEFLDHDDMGALRTRMAGFLQACAPRPLPVGAVEKRRIQFQGRGVEVVIYNPPVDTTSTAGRPLALYFHGGGFTHFSAETHDPVARYLCNKSGAVIVNVDYRLAPENKFPAALEDAYDTLCWASANAHELGADPTKISVVGESAGGTIAIVLCLMSRDRGGPAIARQVPMCASVDLSDLDRYDSWHAFGDGRYLLSRVDIDEIRRVYLNTPDEVTDPRVSPILATDLTGLPPALVIGAECDPLVDEAALHARRLQAAGVTVRYECFAGTIHSFMILAGVIDLGYAALDLVAGYVQCSNLHEHAQLS